MDMRTSRKHIGSVTIVDISGRIVRGEECASLNQLVGELLSNGHHHLVFNLADVSSIDSTGLAYLIASLASVRKKRGDLKLINPRNKVRAVMELSKLFTVFEIGDDEDAAVRSFATLQHAAN